MGNYSLGPDDIPGGPNARRAQVLLLTEPRRGAEFVGVPPRASLRPGRGVLPIVNPYPDRENRDVLRPDDILGGGEPWVQVGVLVVAESTEDARRICRL